MLALPDAVDNRSLAHARTAFRIEFEAVLRKVTSTQFLHEDLAGLEKMLHLWGHGFHDPPPYLTGRRSRRALALKV
jgi:hypothetical protein